MEKRGVSPLIATVLIIGFVVALGAVIIVWGGDLVKAFQKASEKTAEVDITCASKINMDIKRACIFGDKISLQIENIGGQKISSLLFRVEGTRSSTLTDSGQRGLSVVGLDNFEANFDVNTFVGIGAPVAISIFPRIEVNDQEEACTPTKKEIKPCYPLPKIEEGSQEWETMEGDISIMPEGQLSSISPSLTTATPYALVFNASSTKSSTKSTIFTIPNIETQTLNLHLRASKTQGSAQIELRDKTTQQAVASYLLPNEATNSDIIVPVLAEKGREVYLYGSMESGGAMAISEFCYTLGADCVL